MGYTSKRGKTFYLGCYPATSRKENPWRCKASLPVPGAEVDKRSGKRKVEQRFIGTFKHQVAAAVAYD